MAEYAKELEFAKDIASQAGEIILQNFSKAALAVEWKEDNTPVTIADKEINKLVIEHIKNRFPEDGVLGEEQSHNENSERLWVVDPIDGTQPFSIGVPTFTFSLGLVDKSEPILGVVNDPVLKKTYWSENATAYCNQEEIRFNSAGSLANSYVIVSSRMGEGHRETGEVYDNIIAAKSKAFNFRSIVYGFMLVATGQAVAAVAGYCGPWDIAGAFPILKAAGATITDLDGKDLKFGEVKNGILVSNGKVHDQMLELIQ